MSLLFLVLLTSSSYLTWSVSGYLFYPIVDRPNRFPSSIHPKGFSLAKLQEKKISSTDVAIFPDQVVNIWNFTRPHTILGTTLSIISIFLYSTPKTAWKSPLFLKGILKALVPSLLTNIYITGINQITDVDIDKINKPYLPLASGKMSKAFALSLVSTCFLLSIFFVRDAYGFLAPMIYWSLLLGTLYSLPPFRLKRFPFLASFSIVLVRGCLINFGIFSFAKQVVLKQQLGSLYQTIKNYPEIIAICLFFSLFGFVIATMKDIPDVLGDKKNDISTFSVMFSPKLVFRFSTGLLTTMLLCVASCIGMWTWKIPRPPYGAIGAYVVGLYLAADTYWRSQLVDIENPHSTYEYYMHVWKIFYICYLLLPLLAI